jgi:hypothetical protein
LSEEGPATSLSGAVAVIWDPVRTLRRVAEGHRALPGLVVVVANTALGLVLGAIFVLGGAARSSVERQAAQQPDLHPDTPELVARVAEVGTLTLAALYPVAVWLVVSLLMHSATRLFGGTGPLSAMLGVVGVAQVALVVGNLLGAVLSGLRLLAGVGTPVGAVLDYLVFLASLGFSLWFVALVVVGAALARNIGYGESAGSCALSCVGLAVLIIIVVIAAAVGIFATVNAAAP